MAAYEKRVRQILRDNNCFFVRRGKGDHDIWESPLNGKRFPVDGKIKDKALANAVLKQAGLSYRF